MSALRERSRTLSFRIAGLLALALLPVGLISVITSFQLLDRADREMADSLLALTSEAAAAEEAAVRTTTGVTRALVAMVPLLRDETEDCGVALETLLGDDTNLSFLGYVDGAGNVLCATSRQGSNVAGHETHEQFAASRAQMVKFAFDSDYTSSAVLFVSMPVVLDGEPDGYVLAALPHRSLAQPENFDDDDRPLELITFNVEGEVLTSTSGPDRLPEHLPANRALAALSGGSEATFVALNEEGERRLFALVPIVQDQVFALGSWEYRSGNLVTGLNFGTSLLLPLLMWLVSLSVAFFAVQRMVIKPTRNLRARMLQFMRSRKLVEPVADRSTPSEIRDMEDTWMRLAENILHDEAELYDTIHQRTVLLKEVHHRVKNNLQLIVSIVGMKMRKANSPAVKQALGNVQQRVMSIARVHQNLYETSTAERVRVGELLEAIVKQIVAATANPEAKVKLVAHYDDCEVYPDQAVPLSLTVSEFVTNALKYIGPLEGETAAYLEVQLDCEEGGDRGQVTVRNTLAPNREPPSDEDSTGLGNQLVRAFASQMEAAVRREETETHYTAVLDFPIQPFDEHIVPSDHMGTGYKHPV